MMSNAVKSFENILATSLSVLYIIIIL